MAVPVIPREDKPSNFLVEGFWKRSGYFDQFYPVAKWIRQMAAPAAIHSRCVGDGNRQGFQVPNQRVP